MSEKLKTKLITGYIILSYVVGYIVLRDIAQDISNPTASDYFGMAVLWLLSPFFVIIGVALLFLYGIGQLIMWGL